MEINHIEKEVVKLLLHLGISNSGYEFFKKALLIALKQDVVYNSASVVFFWTAEYFHMSFDNVIHSMRVSVDKAYDYNTLYHINNLYGVKILCSKPTISEFFNMAVELLKVFNNCEIAKH